MFKNFIVLLIALLACLACSLTIFIVWPRGTHPKRNTPPVASSIVEPGDIPCAIDFESAMKDDIILFCYNNINNKNALKRALAFYEKTGGNSKNLKRSLEKTLLERPDPLILQFWLEEVTLDQKLFLQEIIQAAKRLWHLRRGPLEGTILTEFLAKYDLQAATLLVQECFTKAQKGDDIPVMLSLIPLMSSWHLLPSDAELASNNFLADALYFYQNDRLQEAYDRLELALFMNERNTKALMLVHHIEERFTHVDDDQNLKLVISP